MKSDLHVELARRSLVWLESRSTNRGIRGCEEVILQNGYVADAAAISGLTLTNEKLFTGSCERLSNARTSDDYSWVFESKVSRNDFFSTFKYKNHTGDRLTPIANFHFIVCPKNLVTLEEIPTFWGCLEKSGAGLSIKKMPEYIPTELNKLHELSYLILRSNHESKFGIFCSQIHQYRQEQELFVTP